MTAEDRARREFYAWLAFATACVGGIVAVALVNGWAIFVLLAWPFAVAVFLADYASSRAGRQG